jgi:predicted urease superfamily metal-dependent hydrolase
LKSEEVLPRVKEERNILQTTKQRKAKRLGHELCWNCLLKCITEGKIEGMGRQGRRHLLATKKILEVESPTLRLS